MNQIKIDPAIKTAINKFSLPENLGFGQIMGPVMASCTYENGKWGQLELIPYGPISMYPSAKVLHYAQEIFEGMKAYSVNNLGPFIFRPSENHLRFNRSAERMAMPHIPLDIFMEAALAVTSYSADFVPRRTGESLYLRPFMFATEEALGIKPSEKFRFLVISSPSGSYFSPGGLSVLIERNGARAFPGGTGFAKAGGNYAASLLSAIKTKQLGHVQTLWLDGRNKKYIEEMSGMNFFAVINNELHTPALNDSILEGITRKSIITLAGDAGIVVVERKMDIAELIEDIRTERCTEAFACGTAAIIAPIDYLAEENGNAYPFKNPTGLISLKLREQLLAIQEGRTVDKYNWVIKVDAKKISAL
jgi:branched-chain amino acid aminotransferase